MTDPIDEITTEFSDEFTDERGVTDAGAVARNEVHVPVLAGRIVDLLAPALAAPATVHVDCTLGMGGHAESVLEACPTARVVGIDRDAEAIAAASTRLARFGNRFVAVRAVYDELPEVLSGLGVDRVHSVLADLGLSSLQIDRRERGFSYASDAALDMRMDTRQGLTAAQVLNTYDGRDLARLLRSYGEEPSARRIAEAIVAAREEEPFAHSARLVRVIEQALPPGSGQRRGHPAKRVFQALRIEVNGELDALRGLLPAALEALAVGGRIAVLAYHSLEDRMVKQAFRAASEVDAPPDLPIRADALQPEFTLLTRGAEKPTDDEITTNPRAGSARLRAAVRVKECP